MNREYDFCSDDLIYNRFDIIFDSNVREKKYSFDDQGKKYDVLCAFMNGVAYLNIWGKSIPDDIIDKILSDIEKHEKKIVAVYVNRTLLNYQDSLVKGKEALLCLPEDEDALMMRLSSKERSHIRQYNKHLAGEGRIVSDLYNDVIPDRLVNLFFDWKKTTHGTEYRLSPQEYIDKYHVTNALELSIEKNSEKKPISVLFWCQVHNTVTVYLENLSYDVSYKKYSPGYLAYIGFLKELIMRKSKYVFLGGANHDYKKKFNSVVRECYTGYIFTSMGFNIIERFFEINKYREWGIWGCGNLGKAVLKMNQRLNNKMSFAIDKNDSLHLNGVEIYEPTDNWPQSDIIIITFWGDAFDVEAELVKRKRKFIRYDEWISELLNMKV